MTMELYEERHRIADHTYIGHLVPVVCLYLIVILNSLRLYFKFKPKTENSTFLTLTDAKLAIKKEFC